jgi:methyltransferase-like protein/2-polyprenyl-3-methyl-5-hydroxy-6-metoxy-1,4-benzoquinol methylase
MTNYDEIPYPLLSHVQTHPDSLATLGTLFGLSPAPIDNCRVLEVGCASGGNLIPAALSLPGSQFVGIDYSAPQVLAGQANAQAAGIDNVRLLEMNVLDVTPELGQFDYIVAHGVYSWVPPEVREGLLRLCRQNLRPNGLAYISYNTYPGWHVLGGLREMMLFHVRDVSDSAERAARARGFLDLMAEGAHQAGRGSAVMKAYSQFLQSELALMGERSDAYLLHDELEDINDPVYFHEFMRQAEAHGLQFVSELDFRSGSPHHLPDKVREALTGMAGTLIEMEQYLDFLRSRTFRQTLLCHREAALDRRITPERLRPFRLGVQAVPESAAPNITAVAVEKFKGSDGAALAIDHPLSKAAMMVLAEMWPQTLPYEQVLPAAQARLQAEQAEQTNGRAAPSEQDADIVAANLLKAYIYSEHLVELHLRQDNFAPELSDRPVASPWARLQAARAEHKVTNLRHERIVLSPLAQFLLPYLDGTRDGRALADLVLAGAAPGGKLEVQQDEQLITDPQQAQQIVEREVHLSLRWLARAALLVG